MGVMGAVSKKCVVFLPYKVSMWDSMESVWQAAKADGEHCDAYVVPIPYADRKPDGSVREWHCEADEYPAYVPVEDWQTFDIKALHPDVIVIHSPYDDINIVTSVEPRFYSRNLKFYTDKLVYIPYFVVNEPTDAQMRESDKRKNITKGIEHFCATPGVIHSDLTIVQSENVRDIYVDVLVKNTDVNVRSFWERRVVGLGSPKFDKVLSMDKETLIVPDDWRRVIEKTDGTWKKIIFYNTGLAAFLQSNEKMLSKIQQVLAVFKEQRDEVALLWRPHPLMNATIKSMRPMLLPEYEAIIEDYCRSGWGIYDDTPDVDRAIVLSDAYYGDWSSVVQLYEKTGKPIMIQNVDM